MQTSIHTNWKHRNFRANNTNHQMVGNIDCTGILISKRVFFTVDNIMYRDFHMLHLSQAGSVSCARRSRAHDTFPAWLRCNMWKSLYIIYYICLLLDLQWPAYQRAIFLKKTYVNDVLLSSVMEFATLTSQKSVFLHLPLTSVQLEFLIKMTKEK